MDCINSLLARVSKLIMYVVERSIRSNFCNGSLPLEIENGRYTKPVTPLDLRTCKYCADNILEDEFTFFFNTL